MQKQYRQGDVFIERIDVVPDGLITVGRERGKVVLAHGEITGHVHAIADSGVDLLARPGETAGDVAERWLRVQNAGGATLTHDEHGAIVLEPGVYRVVHQREWCDDDDPILVVD